jgi:hypothetical protein
MYIYVWVYHCVGARAPVGRLTLIEGRDQAAIGLQFGRGDILVQGVRGHLSREGIGFPMHARVVQRVQPRRRPPMPAPHRHTDRHTDSQTEKERERVTT